MLDIAIGSALVLAGFAAARELSARLGHPPWASPVLVTALVLGGLAYVAGVPGTRFQAATAALRWFLGPAVVALALIIEGNRQWLKGQAVPVLMAIVGGALVGLGSAIGMARLLGIDGILGDALVVKTVSAPFIVAILGQLAGPVSLAAALSVLTGVLGALLIPLMFDRIGVRDAAARALGMGVASHIVGTDWLTRRNPRAGGLAALAFVGVGLLASLIVPPLWRWLA